MSAYLQSLQLENTREITKLIENMSDQDLLVENIGKNFENSLNRIERKQKGQYYTPAPIVRYMIDTLRITDSSKILDPACGCGSFVLGLHDYLSEKYGTPSLKHIFGVDLNPIAVDIARLCLFLKSNKNKSHLDLLDRNIQVGNSIRNDAFDWNVNFKPIMNKGGFDFVIGNPPYGLIRKTEFGFDVPEYFKIIHGVINIASLVIIRSLNLLKSDGKLAFLLPKSLLHVESYRSLRKYILEKSTVLQIYDLGQEFSDVRGEQVILFLQKSDGTKLKPKSFKISIGTDKKFPDLVRPKKEFEINYSLLHPDRFLVLNDPKHFNILNKLENMRNTMQLLEFVDGMIFRGITLNAKQQKMVCGNPVAGGIEVLRGRSISKYKISKLYHIKKTELKAENMNKILALENKQKVVLQNILSSESGIISSFDGRGAITLDTVTNVMVPDKNIGKYLVGLFNSKLINFYLVFGLLNRAKLTVHADRKYVGKIPVVNRPDNAIMKKIISLVDSAMLEKDSNEIKKITGMIDAYVFKLYDISKTDIQVITNAMDKHLSNRSRW